MADLSSKPLNGRKKQSTSKPKTYRLEKNFKEHVRKVLKRNKIYFFVKEAGAIRGIPDIVGCTKDGRIFLWELKKSKWEVYYKRTGKLKLSGRSKLQYQEMLKCRRSGGIADFVFPENFDEKLNEIVA